MTFRFVVRTLSCAGLVLLAGCRFAPADRINAALPPGPALEVARDAMFDTARARQMDTSVLDAELRSRMEKRALNCAPQGYKPGVWDGNDQIRAKLTDRMCFLQADAQLVAWMLEQRSAILGEPRVAAEQSPIAPTVPSAAPTHTTGVKSVPAIPQGDSGMPSSDINATRRAMIERSIRENNVSPEAATAMRKWADDVARKSETPARASQSAAAPRADEVQAGQIDVPSNAKIVAIGVYEAADGVNPFRGPHTAGTVKVFVMKSERPIVLVLSSYEPVTWSLQLQNGAKVSHVLLSGYHASQVFGAPDAQIESIGTQSAYQRGSQEFATLDGLVRQFTGKRIGSFQGAYSGTSFSLNP